LLGESDRERAPTASNFADLAVTVNVQKLRYTPDLPGLRGFERVEKICIEGRRIGQARVELALVEGVAQITVKRDILAAASPRIGMREMTQAGNQTRCETSVDLRF
jgi:hypothetical protein